MGRDPSDSEEEMGVRRNQGRWFRLREEVRAAAERHRIASARAKADQERIERKLLITWAVLAGPEERAAMAEQSGGEVVASRVVLASHILNGDLPTANGAAERDPIPQGRIPSVGAA